MFSLSPVAHGLLALILTVSTGISASPTTDMGEVGERIARQALGGSGLQVVDVQHGPHGMDLAYYDKGRLHVSEVKAGNSQQAKQLSLKQSELELLRKKGIQPEGIGGQRYRVTQGSHAYNLVQMQRATVRQKRVDVLLSQLKQGGKLSKPETKQVANYFEQLKPALTPAEQTLLEQARKGDTPVLRSLLQKRSRDLDRLHGDQTKKLQRMAADIQNGKYTNQLVRVNTQGGRFSVLASPLDAAGNPAEGKTKEIKNINWKYLRESGPFRRLVKDQARSKCAGNRACTDRAYRAAREQLESGRPFHKAMQTMSDTAVQPLPQTKPQSPVNAANSSRKPAIASQVRKNPIMQRVRRIPLGAGRQTILTTLRTAGPIVAAGAGPVGIAISTTLAVGGAAYMFDQYLDGKFETHIGGLKTHIDEQFVKTLEAMDRKHQQTIQRFDELDQTMIAGFTQLSQTLLVVGTKQDRSLALQEAQFSDALQAGIKHYDVYLATGARDNLQAAEQQLTLAQARYENLLDASADSDAVRAERLQHGLASYYRAIVHAERAGEEPEFAEQAIATFVEFVDRADQDPEWLELVLPIMNETYVAITDVDREDQAGMRLTQAYSDLIRHHLEQDQHNQAQAARNLLLLVRDDANTQALNVMVRYLTGEDEGLAEEAWSIVDEWNPLVSLRARATQGTLFSWLACAERDEADLVVPATCSASTDTLVSAASRFDNALIHRYIVTSLLRANRVNEAQDILQTYYIPDPDFRIKQQMTIAYFQRSQPGKRDDYCQIADEVLSDDSYPDSLRQDVSAHRQQWGSFCH